MEKLESRRNSNVVHARNLGKDRGYRDTCGEFLCDGIKLLDEAVKCGVRIESVFTSSQSGIALPEGAKGYLVPRDVLESISPLKNAQDVLFVCKMLPQPTLDCSRGFHILLDNVQDPGNVGTILRSADAFGIESVILTDGCADPYNPKTIRASMGTVFRQKHCSVDVSQLQSAGARLIGTANDKTYPSVSAAELGNAVIVLGSEGSGISERLLSLCESMITIPTQPGCESLNVAIAASIIMYEVNKSKFNADGGCMK